METFAKNALPVLQLLLTTFNILVMIYAFTRFLSKPHTSLESRVTALEVKTKEIEDSLKQGNDRFRSEATTIEVIQICLLALIDFELTFCAHSDYKLTEDLIKAKNLLQEHLTKVKIWPKEE